MKSTPGICVTIALDQNNKEHEQAGRRLWQNSHKFADLMMKNNSLERNARAIFIFVYLAAVLVHQQRKIGSLSNHDDDGNKNPTNLHISP